MYQNNKLCTLQSCWDTETLVICINLAENLLSRDQKDFTRSLEVGVSKFGTKKVLLDVTSFLLIPYFAQNMAIKYLLVSTQISWELNWHPKIHWKCVTKRKSLPKRLNGKFRGPKFITLNVLSYTFLFIPKDIPITYFSFALEPSFRHSD